jgi:hypothetical protein
MRPLGSKEKGKNRGRFMNRTDTRPDDVKDMIKRIFAVATLLAKFAGAADLEPDQETKNRHKNPESDDLGYGESEPVLTSEE